MPRNRTSLLDRVYSRKSLRDAWNGLEKNPRSHGLSGETISNFNKNLDRNLLEIRQQFKSNSYHFSKLRAVPIPKSAPNRFRPIRIPEVRDRVVFKAIANIIQPILDKKLKLANPASYAYQKHLGVRQAIERIVNLYANGRPFVFETDIIKFFDSVDKKLLLSNLVFPNLPDDSLNTLIELVLDLEIGNRDQLSDVEWAPFKESEGGIPQGSALSPLLSNVYLAEFDKVMLARRFGLVRYADDFLVLCKTEKEAEQAFQVATDILENNLGLKLHPLDNNNPESKTRIIRLTQTPVEFLSICFNGKRLWPAKEKITELRTKLRDTTDYHKNSDMLSLLTTTKNLIEGWIAAFYFTDIEPYFDEIEFWINWRLAVSLMTMSWVLEKKSLRVEFHKGNKIYLLSDVQRRRSGVPVCSDILSRIRQNSGKIELLPKAQ